MKKKRIADKPLSGIYAKKNREDLYYEKYNSSRKIECDTISQDTNEKIKKEIELIYESGMTNLDLIKKVLYKKYPKQSNIVFFQLKKFKERIDEKQ